MAWTPERIEALRKMRAEGGSASEIARRLGGVTRSAVIGKLHRLGISGTHSPNRPARTPPKLALPKPKPEPTPASFLVVSTRKGGKRDIPKAPLLPAQAAASRQPLEPFLRNGERVTIDQLARGVCKWPIGDPADPSFCYCGRDAPTGRPYCKTHARLARAAVQPGDLK